MGRMKESGKKNTMLLLLASVAVIWGFGFVFTKQVLAFLSPPMVNVFRFGTAAVIMFVLFAKKIVKLNKRQWLNGIFAGLFMAAGFTLQTYGMVLTSASNAALFMGLNVVMVPFFWWALSRRRPPFKSFAAALLAFASLSVVTFGGVSRVNLGDLLNFLSAVAFALHYVILDRIAKGTESAGLAFVQVLTAAVVSGIVGLADLGAMRSCVYDKSIIFPMFVLCVLNTAFAYYVQSTAQKFVPPSAASLILSCESVLGAVFAVAVGMEPFVWQLGLSLAGMAAALVISQTDFKKLKRLSGGSAKELPGGPEEPPGGPTEEPCPEDGPAPDPGGAADEVPEADRPA